MKISVFGGSQPIEGDAAYEDAYTLGKMLAEAGHTVMTGGYIGTMEATSRGATEAGGHVIGVTCDEIEHWRPVRPNQWMAEEQRRETLIERMQILIRDCDAIIALSGGIGTLAEITLTLNLMAVESIHRRPLVLVGSGWQSVFDQFYTQLDVYVAENQRKLVQFADDVKTAVNLVEN
jgi:uncharacterized protein (TIGR00730 family)